MPVWSNSLSETVSFDASVPSISPTPTETNEIGGHALIETRTGRTIAYWQYRPAHWDADSTDWIRNHPGTDLTIDRTIYQRRNCTGRDEIALTQTALANR